jgi:hypothetical protein
VQKNYDVVSDAGGGAAASTVEDEPALPVSHERFLTNPVQAH